MFWFQFSYVTAAKPTKSRVKFVTVTHMTGTKGSKCCCSIANFRNAEFWDIFLPIAMQVRLQLLCFLLRDAYYKKVY